MAKNWAKASAKVALLTAGLVVIGSGAAYADPITNTNLTSPVGTVLSAVQKATGQNASVPVTLAKKHLDEPQAVLPGSPVQSSAINTAPALTAIETAKSSLAQNAPAAGAAQAGLDKAAAVVKGATGSAPKTLAKKDGPIPGVTDKDISVPPKNGGAAAVGTPLQKVGDPAQTVGGLVQKVTTAAGASGLASK